MSAALITTSMPSLATEAFSAPTSYAKQAFAGLLTMDRENQKITKCAVRLFFKFFDEQGLPHPTLFLKVSHTQKFRRQEMPLIAIPSYVEFIDDYIQEMFSEPIFHGQTRIAVKMECELSAGSQIFESCSVFSNTPSLKDAALQFFGLQKTEQLENKERKDEKKA